MRLVERSEATRNPLCLVFFDWGKAFDCLKQAKLNELLARMGIHNKYTIYAIINLYGNPQFAVDSNGVKSSWRRQRRGIRPGCPFSLQLFFIVMIILLRDSRSELIWRLGTVDGVIFEELMYADDIVFITNSVHVMHRFPKQVEKHAE